MIMINGKMFFLVLVLILHQTVDGSGAGGAALEVNCTVPADIVILLDASDSISSSDWKEGLEFCKKLIDELEIFPEANHVGEVTFSSSIGDTIDLTPYKGKAILKASIDKLEHLQEGTNTAKGIARLRKMIKDGGRKGAPHIGVVVTDGQSKKPKDTIEEANLAKKEGITMITVGVASTDFADELQHVASRDDLYFPVGNYQALAGMVKSLKDIICQDIDNCASHPCLNGAECTNKPGEYICTCLPGYSGGDCEIDIDECEKKPCQNGGTCVDHVNMYTCSCMAGFSGDNCEINIDECAPAPCQNGATCQDKVNAFFCKCVPGYFGQHCETDRNECATNPCQNGGTCTDKVNGYTCSCVAGFSGDQCQTNINECEPKPCENGGTCTDQVNGYKCSCTADFTGERCQTSTRQGADCVIVVDGSESMSSEHWLVTIRFLLLFIDNLHVSYGTIHVGVVVYGTSVGDIVHLSPYSGSETLKFLINLLGQPGEGTNTAVGLDRAHEMFQTEGRDHARQILILITDSLTSTKPELTTKSADVIKKDGIFLIGIGIGLPEKPQELLQIVSEPTLYFPVKSFEVMFELLPKLTDQVFTIAEIKTGADIVAVIDGSKLVSDANWKVMMTFITELVKSLDVFNNNIHFGDVVFGTHVATSISLDPYYGQQFVMLNTKRQRQPKGETNTAAGIKEAREMLTDEGRKHAHHIVLVFTAGRPQDSQKAIQEATAAVHNGITVVTIGISAPGDVADLKPLASNPSLFYTITFDRIQAFMVPLKETIFKVADIKVFTDFVIVVDGSNTISNQDWTIEKDFVVSLISSLHTVGDSYINFGEIVYSENVGDVLQLKHYGDVQKLYDATKALTHPKGGTNTAVGIQRAITMFHTDGRPNANRILLVITDGTSTHPKITVEEASKAKEHGITIMTIDVSGGKATEFTQVVSHSSLYYTVDSFTALGGLIDTLTHTVTEISGNYHQVPTDVVVLTELSNSTFPLDWIMRMSFTAGLLGEVGVTEGGVHFGFVTFNTSPVDVVDLVPFKKQDDIEKLIYPLRKKAPTGSPNTAAAIKKVREMFKKDGRPNAHRILVLITAGKPEFPEQTIAEANLAKREGITLITIVSDRPGHGGVFEKIASTTDLYFPAVSALQLTPYIETLAYRITKNVDNCQPNPCFHGGTCVNTWHGFKCICQKGYLGSDCQTVGNFKEGADVVFLIDGSDSMSDADWTVGINFIINVIDKLDVSENDIHIGEIVFSTSIGDIIKLDPFKGKQELHYLTKKLKHPKGGTNTAAGIKRAREMFHDGGRVFAHHVLIVLTDGGSLNPKQTIEQADLAKHEGITVVTVGVGKANKASELTKIVSRPTLYYPVTNFQGLTVLIQTLTKVVLKQSTFQIHVPVDILLLTDGSDSISDADWRRAITFTTQLIDDLDISQKSIHLGDIVFSTSIGGIIHLAPYKGKDVLKKLVNALKQPKRATNTALGIETARDIFRKEGRKDAHHILIVITDGQSQNPEKTISQANQAKKEGITVITVGIGVSGKDNELKSIVSRPEFFYSIVDYKALFGMITTLKDVVYGTDFVLPKPRYVGCYNDHQEGHAMDGLQTFIIKLHFRGPSAVRKWFRKFHQGAGSISGWFNKFHKLHGTWGHWLKGGHGHGAWQRFLRKFHRGRFHRHKGFHWGIHGRGRHFRGHWKWGGRRRWKIGFGGRGGIRNWKMGLGGWGGHGHGHWQVGFGHHGRMGGGHGHWKMGHGHHWMGGGHGHWNVGFGRHGGRHHGKVGGGHGHWNVGFRHHGKVGGGHGHWKMGHGHHWMGGGHGHWNVGFGYHGGRHHGKVGGGHGHWNVGFQHHGKVGGGRIGGHHVRMGGGTTHMTFTKVWRHKRHGHHGRRHHSHGHRGHGHHGHMHHGHGHHRHGHHGHGHHGHLGHGHHGHRHHGHGHHVHHGHGHHGHGHHGHVKHGFNIKFHGKVHKKVVTKIHITKVKFGKFGGKRHVKIEWGHFSSGSLTIHKCVELCRSINFPFAGLQNGHKCFCGSSFGKYGKANKGTCSVQCSGDSGETCGGVLANSVYATGLAVKPQPRMSPK